MVVRDGREDGMPARPEDYPDMDAIREAHLPHPEPAPPPLAVSPQQANTPYERFADSLIIDYERWHDGVGYDLDALAEVMPAERATIEAMLLERGTRDWRDVEALAALGTPTATAALRAAASVGDADVRSAIMRIVPDVMDESERIDSIVRVIETGAIFGGLTQALDLVETFHPPAIVDALFRGALQRPGEVAVHLAAMIMFVLGVTAEAFDWAERPFFLRFDTPDHGERVGVFRELCNRVGVDPEPYLAS